MSGALTAGVSGVSVDRLRGIELFAGLRPDQLAWLAAAGEPRLLADGEVLFTDGEPAEHFYVLLAGELLISKVLDGREQVVGRHCAAPAAGPDPSAPLADKPPAANQFTGELPLLAGGGYVARASAVGRTELLAYRRETFLEMVVRCPEICRVLLPVLAWRIRSYEAQAGRRTMLAGLATLAAGLAHELNNPVAAVVRTAAEFDCAVHELTSAAIDWGGEALPTERAVIEQVIAQPPQPAPPLDVLAAADAVDTVLDWLADNGVDRAADLAPILAGHGFAPAGLDAFAGRVRAEVLGSALRLLAFRLDATALVGEVAEAGRSISALIASLAGYANLGRAPKRDVDVLEGIEATLTMVASAMDGIEVVRDFAPLPRIPAYLMGLNQVWTNLIRNAVDAMRTVGPHGELRITARQEGDCVRVDVRDSGPGIPAELMPMLFQPFFTTKDIGKGTGLGLHLSHQIIADLHNGSLEVASVPGDTRFVVRLPVDGPP